MQQLQLLNNLPQPSPPSYCQSFIATFDDVYSQIDELTGEDLREPTPLDHHELFDVDDPVYLRIMRDAEKLLISC